MVSDELGNIENFVFNDINWQRAELENFADAINGTAEFCIKPVEALHGVEVMEAISSSINTGTRVSLA